ncbi:ribonuclease H-like domain-containing protein, partial [Mycena pura]
MGLEDLTASGKRGSSNKILEVVEDSMQNMGIDNAQSFLAMTTDDPSTMKAVRRKFEEKYPWIITLACFVHQLNTMIGEICTFPRAKGALQQANRIVTFFNSSHYWGGQLKISAKAEKIKRGLKKNCESRWYSVILLASSVESHRSPLSTIVARTDARKATNGYSAVNAEVVRFVLDADDHFWPMLNQVIRVARPFVDAIAACEGRAATLADCMLQLLAAARRLSLLKHEEDDLKGFFTHAHKIVDKRFRMIATPLHRLALFLHPLCRKFATSGTGRKPSARFCWMTSMRTYYACRENFSGGKKDILTWWHELPIMSVAHPLKGFAIAIHSIVPHAAEIERLFSQLDGVQSKKRINLSVDTFVKLAKCRSNYVQEAIDRGGAVKSKKEHPRARVDEPAAVSDGPTLAGAEEIRDERWEPPLVAIDSEGTEDAPVSGLDAVFPELEERLTQERDKDSEGSLADDLS